MSDVAIRVVGLGKRYRIGERRRYKAMRDTLAEAFGAPLRAVQSRLRGASSEKGRSSPEDSFWALKDVCFEIERGDIVGIIGRNGAGKSTLLKILSRITEPTEGFAEIDGRVGSLLEVGTGFHPELTGRENVYLNGAILGMRKAEIARKFDEIVAFGEVERFIDTPVKFYSSGMYLRLGFAVAAHLEPENLLVDEVLAVGDAAFQNKCMGKMGEVARGGRTVFLVSHNMGAIESLCERCIWVDEGRVRAIGAPLTVIRDYAGSSHPADVDRPFPSGERPSIRRVECLNEGREPCPAVRMGEDLTLAVAYTVPKAQSSLGIGISIENRTGQRIFGCNTHSEGVKATGATGTHSVMLRIPRVLLTPGVYWVTAAVHGPNGETLDWLTNATTFEVMAAGMAGSGNLVSDRNGLVWLDHDWSLQAGTDGPQIRPSSLVRANR